MLLQLLRVRQWYKNLVVFLPLIFSQQLHNSAAFFLTVAAFFCLCLISSASYIINDIADKKKDRFHPEKSRRPVASGKISLLNAWLAALLLLVIGIGLGAILSEIFLYFAAALFLLTQAYTFFLKHEPFADIITISVNFVLRAVSGAFVLSATDNSYIPISHWLILCPFFLALFLGASKRRVEAKMLAMDAARHKSVLGTYNENLTYAMMILATGLLIISYSLYTFFSPYPWLIVTLPIALYAIFRFYYLTEKTDWLNSPEQIYKDARMMVAGALFCVCVYLAVYL